MKVWIDIETTGLDPLVDLLLEVGVIVTTDRGETLWSRSYLIGHEQIPSDRISDLIWKMHGPDGGGLLSLSFHGPGVHSKGVHLEEAEKQIIFDLVLMDLPGGFGPMCGASVHFDRAWLAVHMPNLHKMFSHRNIDVSSFIESAKGWGIDVPQKKRNLHRALPDLEDSIEIWNWFRNRMGGAP